MSPSERKAMINADRTDLSLTKQCKLLKISRSSLYYTPVGVNAETLELMNEIDRVFTKYPFFGSRQIAAYLPRNGFHAGRHRVRRLMGIMCQRRSKIRPLWRSKSRPVWGERLGACGPHIASPVQGALAVRPIL